MIVCLAAFYTALYRLRPVWDRLLATGALFTLVLFSWWSRQPVWVRPWFWRYRLVNILMCGFGCAGWLCAVASVVYPLAIWHFFERIPAQPAAGLLNPNWILSAPAISCHPEQDCHRQRACCWVRMLAPGSQKLNFLPENHTVLFLPWPGKNSGL